MSKNINITTKAGDGGFTRLFSGEQVQKNSSRIDTYGEIDQLVSVLGLARCYVKNDRWKKEILRLQRELFLVSSELATSEERLSALSQRIDDQFLEVMENNCKELNEETEIPAGFVVPGTEIGSTYVDFARTLARNCERKVAALYHDKIISNQNVVIWFNRLSDYLYLIARQEDQHPTFAKE